MATAAYIVCVFLFQGLIGLIMFGGGTLLSNWVFQKILDANLIEKTVTNAQNVAETVKAHNWAQPYLIALGISAALMVAMAVLFNPKKAEQ